MLLRKEAPPELPSAHSEGEGMRGPTAPRGVQDLLVGCCVERCLPFGHLRHLDVGAIDQVVQVPRQLPRLDDIWRANDPLPLPLHRPVREGPPVLVRQQAI